VTLKNGEEIRAKKVISTLDAYSTYIRLMDKRALPTDFVNVVEEIEYTDGYIQIHLSMKDLPTFTKQLPFVNGTEQSWLVAYIRSPEQLHEAYKQYKKGEVPDDPAVYCYFPSQLDPTLAPPGQHTCTLFAHYFPADTPKGEHKNMKNLMADKMLDCIEFVAPGFKGLIMDKAVFTQHYFERKFGATQGDFAQGLLHPGQFFSDRPVPGWAANDIDSFRTPLINLFMAGGGCHPGPGVTCLPGLYGARAVLSELGA
jgi:phytoene dehydrogenase-like protein